MQAWLSVVSHMMQLGQDTWEEDERSCLEACLMSVTNTGNALRTFSLLSCGHLRRYCPILPPCHVTTDPCPHSFMILTVSYRNPTQTFCSPLWFGPRCLQNWIRVRNQSWSKYTRFLSLFIRASALHIFACWPDSLLLQVGERSAQSRFVTQ